MTSPALPSVQKQIRGFLFDVDKTLTNSKGEVSQYTQQVIRRLEDKGFAVGVCTGRGYARVFSHILPYFAAQSLHVVSGGSEVVTTTGERQFSEPLSAAQAQALIEAAQRFQVEFLFDAGAETYGSPRFVNEFQLRPQSEYQGGTIPNLVLYYLTQPFRDWITAQEEFEVIEHESAMLNTTLFDVTAKGVNKARGVQEWAKLQNLAPGVIAGFGDSYNDLSFLSAVGWGVAMGNAVPELQQQAQHIIGHTDEDGLAHYLEENWL